MATAGTLKTCGPTQTKKMLLASFFRGKLLLKLYEIEAILLHFKIHQYAVI